MNRQAAQYVRLFTKWWWLFVISVIIPAVISYYFTAQRPDLYQAKATILVGASIFQDPNPDQTTIRLGNTLAAAYAELLRQGPVIEAVIERLGLDRTPGQLAEQIGTGFYSGAQLLEIQVTDTNPEAAALIANALADELIRRSPASAGSDPEQQEFIRRQLEELQTKVENVGGQIEELTASLSGLTSAAEIQDAQDRITALEGVKSTYQSTYADLLQVSRAESPNALALFEPAVAPQWPLPSKAKLIVAVAGAAGLGLAVGAILLMEFLDTSLRWEGGGAQSVLGLPVLGAVPQVAKKDALSSNNPLSPVAEGVRAVRASIFLMRPNQPYRTLLVTSPGASEGKSFVIANLAVVLAAAGNRVIVIDADMRRPSLHELFDQPNVTGLADVLSDHRVDDEGLLSVPLLETGFDNLYLLPAGRPPLDPATLLTSPRLSALLNSLASQMDMVLIDSPPVLGPPDATVLATLVEGTVLVVSAGVTKRETIQQAKDRLLGFERQAVNLLGLTVNRAKLNESYRYSSDQEGGEQKRKGTGDDDARLTLGEAAARLGIGKDQVRRWCKSGRLPATKKWRLWWRIDPDGLERMLEDTWELKAQV